MNTSHSIEKHELPENILEAFAPVIENLAFELANKYQASLRLQGLYMPQLAFEKLVDKLQKTISVKVAFASKITPKKIDEWDIDVLPEGQTYFETVEPEIVQGPEFQDGVIYADAPERLQLEAGKEVLEEYRPVDELLENLSQPISSIPADVLFDLKTPDPQEKPKKKRSGKESKAVFIEKKPEVEVVRA